MERRRSGHPVERPRLTATMALLGVVVVTPLIANFACSSSGGNNGFTSSSSGNPGSSGMGGAGGSGDGGTNFVGSGGSSAALKVTPNMPIIKVEVPLVGMQTVQFSCLDTMTNLPVPNPVWKLDTIALGTIDTKGLYIPN